MHKTPRIERPVRRSDGLAPGNARDERGLLDRILDTPDLARVVPQLPPQLLHRVIQAYGLEDCGDLVALATPDQLQHVFDVDLWRPLRPGLDEQLDADRFGVWLDVLMESGAAIAAEKIVGMNVNLVIAALAEHMLVFDRAAVSPLESPDGDETIESRKENNRLVCEVGGYLAEARRSDAWDPIVSLLLVLDSDHPDYFHRVMRGCRSLSNSGFERDGLHDLLDDREQDMFDLAVDREQRRDKRGYVTPAQARAFLHSAQQLQRDAATGPPPSQVARAYFRAIERTPSPDAHTDLGHDRLPAASASTDAPLDDTTDPIAKVVHLLVEAGVLTEQPRALLNAPQNTAPELARIHALMQIALDIDPIAHSMRTEELAYLANTLVAGCSVQARAFTEQEASDAALATCNLGLENWPRHWLPEQPHGSSATTGDTAIPEDFLVDHDLVSVFQVGWTVLHEDVCMHAAGRLHSLLTDVRCNDHEIQSGLDALRIALARHSHAKTPWHARDALDVIAILDMPAWAALLGLIAECPVIHAGMSASPGSGIRAVDASAFTFISENSQIASVRAFMRSLPETLFST